jgi:hypothetical protein
MNKKEVYNKQDTTNPNNMENFSDIDLKDNIEHFKKNTINTEFKIMPGKTSQLCLMDPIILSWIVSIVSIIIYIVAVKYKPKDI